MQEKLLLLVFSLMMHIAAATGNSTQLLTENQSALLKEDFNNCTDFPPIGWTSFSVLSNHDWTCSGNGRGASGKTGDFAAEMNGYGADTVSEDWLITPEISLTNQNYVLNFNSMLRYGGPALEVLYSTDYTGNGSPQSATWLVHDAATKAIDKINSWDYVNSGNIPLTGLSGNVHFAFRYTSSGTGSGEATVYRIDDVNIKLDIVLYENFNSICSSGNYTPKGWTIFESGTSGLVACSQFGFIQDTSDFSLQCNGYKVGAGEVWTITPLLKLENANHILNFASVVSFNGPLPTVLYSTNYTGTGNPNLATWNEITAGSNAITRSFIKSPDIDLSFIDSSAYIAFKYVSEGAAGGQSQRFSLDEVLITKVRPGNSKFFTISQIQGSSDASPLVNASVKTAGIVTGYFNGVEPYQGAGYKANIQGFYIQSPKGDENSSTSEGIFISSPNKVDVGDSILLTGLVSEQYGLTQISDLTSFKILSSGHTVRPTIISMPLDTNLSFEQYESMLITIANDLVVTDSRNVQRYGELVLSAEGIMYNPTQLVDPNDIDPNGVTASGNSNVPAVLSYMKENRSKSIILDDAREKSNQFPVPYLDTIGTVRTGSIVKGLSGILSYGFSAYRLLPTTAPEFTYSNRDPLPSLGEPTLKVASFNVLNYFNGDGKGGGFPSPRGARTYEDFLLQTQKIVAALAEMDADVVGLIEMENEDDDGFSAIKTLIDALNARLGTPEYDFVVTNRIRPATGRSDLIKNALIYKTASVGLVGAPAILNSNFDPAFIDIRNRPSLAQTFADLKSGEQFTVVVNHLRSKSGSCSKIGDINDGDGQGECNQTRTNAAGTLATWLSTNPTNSNTENYILLGDFNAYGQEDPIDTLRARGYINLLKPEDYSYIYKGEHGALDHVLTSQVLLNKVTGAVTWNINSTEPEMLAYYNSDSSRAVTPYRSSDHDPVIIGLQFIPDLKVSGFTLIDASNDEDIMKINPTDTIDYATIKSRRLNIRADVDSIAEKVFIGLWGRTWAFKIDNSAPYTIFHYRNEKYCGRQLRPGNYTLMAVPFRTHWFDRGEELKINFTIINSSYPHRRFKTALEEEKDVIKVENPSVNFVFPMPFESELTIKLSSEIKQNITLRVFNAMGAEVIRDFHSIEIGNNTITEHFHELESGLYILVIDELQFNQRIIKQ